MAENAPINIGKPYVVIVTPTRELCTQVRSIKYKILINAFSTKKNSLFFIRSIMKHGNSPKIASLNVARSMVEQRLGIKIPT